MSLGLVNSSSIYIFICLFSPFTQSPMTLVVVARRQMFNCRDFVSQIRFSWVDIMERGTGCVFVSAFLHYRPLGLPKASIGTVEGIDGAGGGGTVSIKVNTTGIIVVK